jgi:hypothetical protein
MKQENKQQYDIMSEDDKDMDAEIHTIQVFREAICCEEDGRGNSSMIIRTVIPDPSLTMAHIPYFQAELCTEIKSIETALTDDGIGGDWAFEMDESEIVENPGTAMTLDPLPSQGGGSSLFSFYFDTPLAPMKQDTDGSDDFTITSHDTESFHDTSDLNLDSLEDTASFWEQGLGGPSSSVSDPRYTSPAHVSLSGDSFAAMDRK